MNKFVLVVLLVVAAPSFAIAGGGGSSKSNGTVKVVNNSSTAVGVAVNPSASLLASTNSEQFVARGGKIIDAGKSATFTNVKVGNARLIYGNEIPAVNPVDTKVLVKKGVTTTFEISDSDFAN